MRKLLLAIVATTALSANTIAQQSTPKYDYIYPLNVTKTLSANFGELRANHFHSGIDMKTDGGVNKNVISIEDGYVSRIAIAEWGYGLALYIDHPKTGQTSVYGHLNKFAPKIAKLIAQKQYEQETYCIDLRFAPEQLPVSKGELVAYSGNTGSSFGPHVHFELRNMNNQEIVDPLSYFKTDIADKTRPEVRGIAIYPQEGLGVVNNSASVDRHVIAKMKDGLPSRISRPIRAWGKVGVGIYSIDRMDGTNNVYGVKKVDLYCNNELIFAQDISAFRFDQSRMINSLTDFDNWKRNNVFYMKSFIEPGNKLSVYKHSVNDGYIDINETKNYNMRYELEDAYGNKTSYQFIIEGYKQSIADSAMCHQAMPRIQNNYFVIDGFNLNIPKYNLYSDIGFTLAKEELADYLSDAYMVNTSYVPLDNKATLRIKIKNDTLSNKSQYGLIRLHKGKESWAGGKYHNGYIRAQIGELGNTYAVSVDTEAPKVEAIQPETWAKSKKITMQVTDNLSGVASYRGTINDKFVLIEHDGKSKRYYYIFDDTRLKKGEAQHFEFVATDACGNETKYTHTFNY